MCSRHTSTAAQIRNEESAPLRADAVYRLLDEITQPPAIGLEAIRRGWFGRRVAPDIVQVLHFSAAKGGTYVIQWGVSLAFVPHEFERRIRFHRTLKSVDLDLFEGAPEEFARRGPQRARRVRRRRLRGVRLPPRRHRCVGVRPPRVAEWWASTATVDGVLARTREQMAAALGPRHWPDAALVEAFALARLGRDDEARSRLGDWLATRGSLGARSAVAAENLARALAKVQSAASA